MDYHTKASIVSRFKDKLETHKQKRLAKKLYADDYRRFIKYSFMYENGLAHKKKLEARIVFHYHALEKGLSHKDFKKGFGKTALNGLVEAMSAYKKNYDPDLSIRYHSGLEVLKAYVRRHDELNYSVPWAKRMLKALNDSLTNAFNAAGGIHQLTKDTLTSQAGPDFESLAMNRYSIRDFGETRIPEESIDNAIRISMKTPSISNRQGWHVRKVKDKDQIGTLLEIQGGLIGHGENIDTLLLVTGDYTALGDAGEYKQAHIDSGMFAMSLLYALTDEGLATCPLNLNLHPKGLKAIRHELGIQEEESLTMFIAVGSHPEEAKIPKSQRDPYKDHTKTPTFSKE